jgi:polysaccharide deacetylase 2 family uncharacterized protein YibQ
MPAGRTFLLLLALIALTAGAGESPQRPRLAVIIDDLGYDLHAGERALRLPGPVACAILPLTPRGEQLAREAHANGKDVLLHLPLQAEQSEGAVEPGGLLLDMSRSQFAEAFASNFAAVPHASGVNSHRGSMLTRHPGHMSWLMEELSTRGDLFFVDSYTTPDSIALKLAIEAGVPATRRDVFLDPDRSPETLVREFARLKKLARENGFAVGIGHPYPATLEFLENALPGLDMDGYELVSISELIALQRAPAAD